MRIAFLGAGMVAQALATLWRNAGHETRLSRRQPTQGEATFADAATWGEVTVIAIPYIAVSDVLPPLAPRLAGKVVVDATNPLGNDWAPIVLGAQTSAGETVASLLPQARVVKAFNTIFADVMAPERIDRQGRRATAFIASDERAAGELVSRLAADAGFAPLYTGALLTGRYLEAMAHLNIAIAVGQGGGTNAAFIYDQAVS